MDELSSKKSFYTFFVQIVEEKSEDYSCSQCVKVCKSKGGLTRHVNTMHKSKSPNEISLVDLTAMLNEIKVEASENQCYDETIRRNFRDYNVVVEDPFLKEVNRIYKTHLAEHSKTDKFISTFYGSVVLFSSKFYPIFRLNMQPL